MRFICQIFILLLTPSFLLSQTTYNWIGANGGDWSTNTNWNPTGLPGPSDTAVLNLNPSTDTISLSVSVAVNALESQDGFTINSNSQCLTIGSGGISLQSAACTIKGLMEISTSLVISLTTGSLSVEDVSGGDLVIQGDSSGFVQITDGQLSSYANTTIEKGSLQISGNPIFTLGNMTIGPHGTFFTIGVNQTIGDLIGSGLVTLYNSVLTAGTTTSSVTYSGVINEQLNGSFVKQGTGTLIFSGANSYSLGTTINAGI